MKGMVIMLEKCFFDRRKNCIVQKKKVEHKNEKGLVIQQIQSPMKECISCLLYQILKELKEKEEDEGV